VTIKILYSTENKREAINKELEITVKEGSCNTCKDTVGMVTEGLYRALKELAIYEHHRHTGGRPSHPIQCVQTGRKFNSIGSAAREMGLDPERLREVVDKPTRKHKGYSFIRIQKEPE